MVILSSDTSTKTLSAALIIKEGKETTIFNTTKNLGMTHSQTHMPLIMRILSENNKKFSDIDIFASTIGPGSYTGIRIGVSTTKTMAYAAGKIAIGVSTLQALAFPHKNQNTVVCPIIDARNRRVFGSAYLNGLEIIKEDNISIDDLVSKICGIIFQSRLGEIDIMDSNELIINRVIFCGDASEIYKNDEAVIEAFDAIKQKNNNLEVSFIKTNPEASVVAEIAYEKYCSEAKKGDMKSLQETFSPFLLEANYLSASQAQRMKNQKRMESNSADEIKVSAATVDDLKAIHDLEMECFTIPWSYESIKNDLSANSLALLLKATNTNDTIVGYIGIWQVLDEGQITNLAVGKKFRGNGVGKLLINEACSVAAKRGVIQLTLEVRPTNIAALNVYESEGFQKIAIRKGYYQDNGEDAIIMLKKLV